MIIETKFNKEDKVFYIHDSNIKEAVVNVVKFSTTASRKGSHISYLLSTAADLYETELYHTKEEAGKAWLESQGLDCGLHNV